MNGKRRLVVHGVSAEAWASRYGIEAFSHPCSECGRECTTSIPFAQGQLRGLQAPPCPCGNARTPFGLVRDPKHGDLFTEAAVMSEMAAPFTRVPAGNAPKGGA